MQKNRTNKLLLGYVIKVIITSILSILCLSSIFSYVVLRFDVDLSVLSTISIICLSLSSFIVSLISTHSFKNNTILMSYISVMPLVLFSLINVISGQNELSIFLIKLCIMILLSTLSGYINSKRNKKIKV